MDQAEVVRDYRALRTAGIALNTRLARMLSKDELQAAGRALGMMRGKHLVLETQEEINVIMDYAIHNSSRGGRNAVDRMLDEEPPPEGSLELRLLRSMQKSHYTIFEVQTVIRDFGVRGLDGPKQMPILIVDMGFSQTAEPGLPLATRIHSPGEGWWMTTGAALPLDEEAMDRINHELEEHERRFAAAPTDQERATIITRACVASGASRHISYSEVGKTRPQPSETPTFSGTSKVGRNDPCPCGSGRKYKKCCGM